MRVEGQSEDWERIIRGMIERSRETAPSEPGVYKMPCGECVVDFFITAEGVEHWLVAGDGRSYTRESVVVARHGAHPWCVSTRSPTPQRRSHGSPRWAKVIWIA